MLLALANNEAGLQPSKSPLVMLRKLNSAPVFTTSQ